MSESKHTQGDLRYYPVDAAETPNRRWMLCGEPESNDGMRVAFYYGPDAEANAALGHAAPEMLEAAKPFVDPVMRLRFMGHEDKRIYLRVSREQYEAMKAAIAKAEGRAT